MKIFQEVREKLGWPLYKMAQQLQMGETAYRYLERTGDATSQLKVLELFRMSGWSATEFMKRWAECAEADAQRLEEPEDAVKRDDLAEALRKISGELSDIVDGLTE